MSPVPSLRSVLPFLLAVLCFILSGCQGEKPPEAIHSCRIFSDSEIDTLFGPTVERPPTENHRVNEETGDWMSSCNYYSPQTNLSAGIMLKPFIPYHSSAESAYKAYVTSITSNISDYEMKEISNIGEKAVWNGQLGQLTFFEGTHMVIISILRKNQDEDAQRAFCTAIAHALIHKNIL